MKKILKMMFVLAFLLVQIVPATLVNADESGTNNNSGTITINNVEEGRVYTIYEILQLESYDTTKNAYAYKATTEWVEFVNSKGIKDVYLTIDSQGYVTWKDNTDDSTVAAFAKLALQYAETNVSKITKKTSITASSSNIKTTTTTEGKVVKSIEFTGLNLGYYLVDSSLGTICGLTTTKPSATIEEKNTVPTVDKKVKEDSGDYGESNTAQIGQEVEFKTTITIGKGAINYTLHDIMSTGLTFKEGSIKVEKTNSTGTTTVDSSNYEVVTTGYTDGCTFEIRFDNDFIKTLTTSDKLVVTYKAILNKDAVVEGNGNPNETYVKYGDNGDLTTDKDTTTTYTYDFQIVKTKSDHTFLDGAEFDLYTTESGGNKIPLIALNDENGYKVYRVATAEEANKSGFVSAKIQAGKVIIKGLDLDKYYLEETKAPNGYNQLPARVAFTVTGTTADDVSVVGEIYQTPNHGLVVVNNTGNELPSTGGIGTMLFVLIGSMMVLGCGVLLVTKLRMTKMSD